MFSCTRAKRILLRLSEKRNSLKINGLYDSNIWRMHSFLKSDINQVKGWVGGHHLEKCPTLVRSK